MKNKKLFRIKTITEFHCFRQLPRPEHPLISVIDIATVTHLNPEEPIGFTMDFYMIALKRTLTKGILKYGQQKFDFDGGIMSFTSPNQVLNISIEKNEQLKQSGYVLLVHPDFIWNTTLAKNIKQYEYFGYAVNEALFLTETEENIIISLLENIRQEYQSNIDGFSQDIIISHLETLLKYADRFYHRQFLTRKKLNDQILERFEKLLANHFKDDDLINKGLPTVHNLASNLNLSVCYLSRLLKSITGLTTQQHIHEKLISVAKEKLSTTDLSVNEIAYELGFEHSQSFSKLFKSKTNKTPLEFRIGFN